MPLIVVLNVVASTLVIAGIVGYLMWGIFTRDRTVAHMQTELGPYQIATARGVLQLIPVRP